MARLVKNKRSRGKATDDEMPPVDSKRCVIALLPGDREMMENFMLKTVCVLMTYFKYITEVLL